MGKFTQENCQTPINLLERLERYMNECGYSKGNIKMKLGNLNYLFCTFKEKRMMEMLYSSPDDIWNTIDELKKELNGGVKTSDVDAFKIMWEEIHGIELIKKRVTPKLG